MLLPLATLVAGLALAGSQVKRHIRRLRSGLTAATVQGAAADSVLVALGTVLARGSRPGQLGGGGVVAAAADPGRRPPTGHRDGRAPDAADHRRHPAGAYPAGHGDYIDGEVVDVTEVPDVEPQALPRKPE